MRKFVQKLVFCVSQLSAQPGDNQIFQAYLVYQQYFVVPDQTLQKLLKSLTERLTNLCPNPCVVSGKDTNVEWVGRSSLLTTVMDENNALYTGKSLWQSLFGRCHIKENPVAKKLSRTCRVQRAMVSPRARDRRFQNTISGIEAACRWTDGTSRLARFDFLLVLYFYLDGWNRCRIISR